MLFKVSSDELKRSYAEQIVDELMDGFVLPPKEKKLVSPLKILPKKTENFGLVGKPSVYKIWGLGFEFAQRKVFLLSLVVFFLTF